MSIDRNTGLPFGYSKSKAPTPLTSPVVARKNDGHELKTRFPILEVCAVITAASTLTIAVTLIAIYLK